MDAGLRLPRGQCRAFLGEMPNRPLLHAAWDTGGWVVLSMGFSTAQGRSAG